MIQKALGDDATSATQIEVWHQCFKDGQEQGMAKSQHDQDHLNSVF